ncbi:hypothetical protein [Streptomyces sp. NRRL S-118]|uniref:hypothetical protein n=1 Tax=Streptomyces sp. NRRL S-118 TaxID=1463881 RepID=UPI000AD975D5|nr:hypothetical protein [Streptomyces sp. NRRL S-118]
MGPEELMALTAAAGAALVQAAGTDAWAGMRAWAARWSRRVGEQRQRAELEHLDAAEAGLTAAAEPGAGAGAPDAGDAAHRAGYWSGRLAALLQELPPAARAEAVAELRALLRETAPVPRRDTGVRVSGTFNGPVQNGDGNHMVIHQGPAS